MTIIKIIYATMYACTSFVRIIELKASKYNITIVIMLMHNFHSISSRY